MYQFNLLNVIVYIKIKTVQYKTRSDSRAATVYIVFDEGHETHYDDLNWRRPASQSRITI